MEKLTSEYACRKKRAFDTEEEALKELSFLKVSKEYRKLKRAYQCNRCGNWHLSSKSLTDKHYGKKKKQKHDEKPWRRGRSFKDRY